MPSKSLDTVWVQAAVVGGLWASVEIILGSFLHNLRIPLSGSILTAFSVIILVAFYQMWPRKGMLWRAGLICALMKSISPSAIILGPMIGIFTVAIIVDITLRFTGNYIAGYLLAGALSLLSTIGHKIVSLLIVYGLNIVKIYVNLFKFATTKLSMPGADPVIAFVVLLVAYMVIGTFTGLFGFYIGKKVQSMKAEDAQFQGIKSKTKEIFTLPSTHHFSLPLFILHGLAIPAGLIMVTQLQLYQAAIFIIAYATFVVFHYPSILRRLKKPFFWVQLLIITALSTFFWSIQSRGIAFNPEGFRVGLGMTLRALLILSGFSGISTELRNPVIKSFLLKKGFSNIYQAISMAFNALPVMIGYMPKAKEFFKKPTSSIAGAVLYAEYWYQNFLLQQDHFQRDTLHRKGA